MKKWIYPLLITLLFLTQFFFISPIGEFALNDDWVHTEILKHWVDTGEFRMNPFAGPTFYVPILYGAGLSILFGFSFTILRISTLVLALATLILFHALLNKINHKPHLNFFIVLALWLNPIFYSLSFTFMTDIPALMLLTCSIYAYYQAFDTRKPGWIFVGSVSSVLGFFIRQTNIFVMIAAGIYEAYIRIKNLKLPHTQKTAIPWKHLLWSFGIPTIIWGVLYYLLQKNNMLPQVIGLHEIEGGLFQTRKHAIWWSWYSIMYLGFFTIPFYSAYISKNFFKKIKNKVFVACVISVLLSALIIKWTLDMQFPYVLNSIVAQGIGPIHNVIRGSLVPLFSTQIWGLITILSALSGGYLCYLLSRKQIYEKPVGFVYIYAILYLIPLLIFTGFDRYYLPLFVIVSIVVARHLDFKKYSVLVLIVSIGIMSVYSISQTKFYLAWNYARWELATKAVIQQGVKTHDIDGGYEWNGWHAYWSAYEAKQDGTPHGRWTGPWWIRSLFVNNTEEYIVSFSPLENYEILESKKIEGLNPNNTLYLLHKN
ncbi:MAG: glycosyltransferase family 39 protein [Candidatus Magasanikbacteria bacterium]|nr:glycosyltransferase family 39 protein [Candidatus Magasanikbacteria bacterium]